MSISLNTCTAKLFTSAFPVNIWSAQKECKSNRITANTRRANFESKMHGNASMCQTFWLNIFNVYKCFHYIVKQLCTIYAVNIVWQSSWKMSDLSDFPIKDCSIRQDVSVHFILWSDKTCWMSEMWGGNFEKSGMIFTEFERRNTVKSKKFIILY